MTDSVTRELVERALLPLRVVGDDLHASAVDYVLDAGAEEVEDMGESFEIYSEPGDIVAVRTALTEAGMDYDSAEVQFVAGTKVEVDVEGARKVFRLIDALEDSDDVQNVYTSVDLSPEVAAEFAGDED